MAILVYTENAQGKFKKHSLEALTYATELGKKVGLPVTALSIGNVDAAELAKLGQYGATKVLTINTPALHACISAAYASAIAAVAQSIQARFVVLDQGYEGRAIAPRVAVKLKAPLFSGVTEVVSIEGSGLKVRRSAYSGKAIQYQTSTKSNAVITVKPNAFGVISTNGSATVETFDYTPVAKDLVCKPVDFIRTSDKIALTEAEIVVSAGRGLKGPENWGMIEELAGILGAATACSKPVADVDWRPHHEHVGQTGIQIAPNVYIAVGISGAIQHLAGVNSSKTIIVINKDPEAPFFKAADYGIVGDAFDVVPKLISEIKTYKSSHN